MKEQIHTKWRIADIGTLLKNSFLAIIKGELLLRMQVGKHFVKYLYTFLLLALLILLNLLEENTLSKVERNNETLKQLEVVYSDKTFQVASMSRRSSIAERLKEMGSKLEEPANPAIILEK